MFYIVTEARYTGTNFEGTHVDAVIMKDAAGDKLIVFVHKEGEHYDLIKSGKWLRVKLSVRVRSKVKSDGSTFVETRVYPEEVKELNEKELAKLATKPVLTKT